MLMEPWRIQLLGGLGAVQGDHRIQRFRTQKYGLLLAYLAYFGQRSHSRETLVTLLWPEAEPEAGRLSLRVALASLRKQLEPPGVGRGSVLTTQNDTVRLHPDAFQSDVQVFEQALRSAEKASDPTASREHLITAVAAYGGRLLPGFYEDWVSVEQARLEERYRQALHDLIKTLMQLGDRGSALNYGHRAVGMDPLDEEAQQLLIRLYLQTGQPAAARRQFQEFAQRLHEEIGARPAQATQRLLEGRESTVIKAAASAEADTPNDTAPAEKSPALAVFGAPTPLAEEPPRQEGTASPKGLPLARLPVPLTRFFGRETEMTQVEHLLVPSRQEWQRDTVDPAQRLVTLTGPGGTGKTRLAIEVARRLNAQAGLPVTFVPLADITEPNRVLEAIARAMALSSPTEKDLLEEVTTHLAMRPQVLLLDNFEQLLPGADTAALSRNSGGRSAAATVQMLLECVPALRCLVTSRQCLDLEGEQEFLVSPLPTPAYAGTPERLLEFASVKLFVNRAQLSRPDFQLTSRNADVIGSLCTQLEGLPLSLELAAAWVSTLSPAQIKERLMRRFDLLIGRRRGSVSRHHSLRAAVEWSYHLLSPELQRFLAQLSVFRGGWTVEAAEAVCEEPQALNSLRALRHRSLVVVEEQAADDEEGPVRFHLLETLREFAWEQLREEERERLGERHARWSLARLKQDDFQPVEQNNYRAAHDWARERPQQTELYFELLCALVRFWRTQGWWREGQALLKAGLERDGDAYPLLYGVIYHGMALMAWLLEEPDTAMHYFQQALDLFTELGDTGKRMSAWNSMGCVELGRKAYAASQQNFEQALHLAEALQDDPMAATIHGNLGYVALQQEDWPTAQEHMQKCLSLHQKCHLSEAWALQNLGVLAQAQEQWVPSRTYLEESLRQYRRIGETYRVAEVLEQLSLTLEQSGESEEAARCRAECQMLSIRLRGS